MNNRHRRVSKLKAQERKREWMKWELTYDEVSGLICEIYDGITVALAKSFQAVSDTIRGEGGFGSTGTSL